METKRLGRKMRPGTNVKGIIMSDGQLLAIKKRRGTRTYYVLPGGSQNPDETLVETLEREVREETGATVEVGDLAHVRDYIGAHHEFASEQGDLHRVEFFFHCRLVEPPGTRDASHVDSRQIGLAWLPVADIPELPLYPKALARALGGVVEDAPIYLGDVN